MTFKNGSCLVLSSTRTVPPVHMAQDISTAAHIMAGRGCAVEDHQLMEATEPATAVTAWMLQTIACLYIYGLLMAFH